MSTPARIIPFPSVTAPDFNNWSVADTTADIDTRLRDAYRESSSAAEGSAYRERITIDELYSADQALTPELSVALSLLAKGLEDVDEALAATQKGSDIFADDAIQRFQALLPELFTCRNLSDSFGAIINATLCSLENLRGLPMNQSQILILKQVLYRLRSEPFMRFESAVEEIMKLEEAGLIVEPLEFEALADWLDE